jgi:hypothetical protein
MIQTHLVTRIQGTRPGDPNTTSGTGALDGTAHTSSEGGTGSKANPTTEDTQGGPSVGTPTTGDGTTANRNVISQAREDVIIQVNSPANPGFHMGPSNTLVINTLQTYVTDLDNCFADKISNMLHNISRLFANMNHDHHQIMIEADARHCQTMDEAEEQNHNTHDRLQKTLTAQQAKAKLSAANSWQTCVRNPMISVKHSAA